MKERDAGGVIVLMSLALQGHADRPSKGCHGAAMAFVRLLPPGAALPRHRHDGYEHILILRGSRQDDDGEHYADARLIHPPGSPQRVSSAKGCIVLTFWERPVRST